MRRMIFLALCLIMVALGCDSGSTRASRYLFKEHDGQVFRFDTNTGEVVIFNPDGSIKKYDNKVIGTYTGAADTLGDLRIDDSQEFPEASDVIWAETNYKWRDGMIHFRFTCGPYDESLHKIMRRENSHLTLDFHDSDGFVITSAELPLKSFMRLANSKGEWIYWEYKSQVACSSKNYRDIAGVQTRWTSSDRFNESLQVYVKNLEEKAQQYLPEIEQLIAEGRVAGEIKGGEVYIKQKDKMVLIKKRFWKLVAKAPQLYSPEDQSEKAAQ